ncbi:hypothetical protein NEUTE2DRAFT_166341 [Neurospora tetrasperma FGSC 2509]|nr:hypothetical protein NEUTE2DRAFT_166341 [Neurospora tetrasperma FGSC 2509]
MCQLAYVLSPWTHSHHSLARDQRRSQCCHLVCITYCCAATAAIAAARQSESPNQVPRSPSGASSSSFSSLINYDDDDDDTNSNSNNNTPPLSPLPREETPPESTSRGMCSTTITFNRTTTPTFILHHVRQAHQCSRYNNVQIERPRDWYYYGSMLAFAVETLPRAREGYTLSWRWVSERMMGSHHDGGTSRTGEIERRDRERMGHEGREGRDVERDVERDIERDVEGRDIAERERDV